MSRGGKGVLPILTIIPHEKKPGVPGEPPNFAPNFINHNLYMTAMKESKCKCRMQLWGMLGCILLATACKEANEQPLAGGSYETMKVTVSDQELNTAYSATIRGRQDIDIYPQVSGTIQELCVAEGEKVRTGQTLFIIDQVPYRAALNTTEHRYCQREVGTSGIGDCRTDLREQQGTAQAERGVGLHPAHL